MFQSSFKVDILKVTHSTWLIWETKLEAWEKVLSYKNPVIKGIFNLFQRGEHAFAITNYKLQVCVDNTDKLIYFLRHKVPTSAGDYFVFI